MKTSPGFPTAPAVPTAPVLPTPSAQQTAPTQPPGTLPPAPTSHGQSLSKVGQQIPAKQYNDLMKALSTMVEDVKAAPDRNAVNEALQNAKAHVPSSFPQVREALDAMAKAQGNYLGVLAKVPEQNGLDELKHTARLMDERFPARDVRTVFGTMRKIVVGGFDSYAKELASFDAAKSLPGLKNAPEGIALNDLLYAGATDVAEAQSWLKDIRNGIDISADVQAAAKHRLENVREVYDHTQHAFPAAGGAKQLAELVLRFPVLKEHVFNALDDASELNDALREVKDAQDHLARDTVIGAGTALASFVPVFGTAVAAGVGGAQIYKAYDAAMNARVCAALGLVTREQAERLDNDIAWTFASALVSTALSTLPGAGALWKNAQKSAGGFGLVKAAADLAKAHPATFAAIAGTLNAATQADVREAIANDDYLRAAMLVGFGAAAGFALGAVPGLARNLGEIRKKVLEAISKKETPRVVLDMVQTASGGTRGSTLFSGKIFTEGPKLPKP